MMKPAKNPIADGQTPPLSSMLARYDVAWERYEWPMNWAEVFGGSGRLEVEVGFGNGSFLTALAGERPGANFVGIETSWGSARRLFRRLAEIRLTNIRVLLGPAATILRHAFPPKSIAHLYVNFPDPWRKRQHHSRKFIRPRTLELLATRLVAGGKVTIATDHFEYAEWIRASLEDQTLLSSCFSTSSVDGLPGRIPTKYEKKALARQERIYYFVWEKTKDLDLPEPAPSGTTMPNATLQAIHLLDEPIPNFLPREWRLRESGQDLIVKALKMYRMEGSAQFLIEMFAQEGELSQRFGVAVYVRPNATVMLRLASLGYPRPTRGVKAAVRCLAQWVLDSNPGTRVIQNKVGPLQEREISPTREKEISQCEKAP